MSESTTITFLGQTFNRADLSQELINYIQTYNEVDAAPKTKSPDDNDFHFRMNQALQMFGDPVVVEQIQIFIDFETDD